MQKGQIRVQTENIFPIIKKFLYSDHEIFLRELVSNAVDASQKLKTLSSKGEVKGDIGNLRVDVILDAKEKTIYKEEIANLSLLSLQDTCVNMILKDTSNKPQNLQEFAKQLL